MKQIVITDIGWNYDTEFIQAGTRNTTNNNTLPHKTKIKVQDFVCKSTATGISKKYNIASLEEECEYSVVMLSFLLVINGTRSGV